MLFKGGTEFNKNRKKNFHLGYIYYYLHTCYFITHFMIIIKLAIKFVLLIYLSDNDDDDDDEQLKWNKKSSISTTTTTTNERATYR